MLSFLIVYALIIYWLFHVIARSDILAHPRAWVLRTLPAKLTYPLSCSFCFTIWTGILLTVTGVVGFSPTVLFAAPVVNLVLDLCVRAFIRANEPSVLLTPLASETTTSSSCTGNTWSGTMMWATSNSAPVGTPINIPTMCVPTEAISPNPVYPEPHPSHVGCRVRVISGTTPDARHLGKVGIVRRHYTDNSDSTINFRPFRYDIAFDNEDGFITTKILVADCLLLNEDPPAAGELV